MKPRLRPLHDQVVVLFGATSGIGLETALHMVEKGSKVVVVGRNQEGLNDAVERIRSHARASFLARGRRNGQRMGRMTGSNFGESGTMGESTGYAESTYGEGSQTAVTEMEDQVISIEADATNFEQVRSVADQTVQRFGRIDTWVNIAAVSEWALFEDTSAEEFRRIIEVNLIGHAYGAMAALPYMKQQHGGALIFVSSVAGRVPIPYQSAYNASKHGILGLVETLRQELKHTQVPISVTAILPASINTPLFSKARTKIGVEPEPIPPIYDAKMVAKAIAYAAQHPVRELIVGDSGYAMTFMRRLAPTLTSNYMGATGFRQQRSNEPKSPQAPDNLYQHLSGYSQVDGEFTPRTRRFSPMTWLSTHPKARLATYGLLAGGLALLVNSRMRSARRHQTFGYQVSHRAKKLGNRTGALLASLPLIGSLPMFERKSIIERFIDWLPINRRKSFTDRISDRLPERMPFSRSKSFTDRISDRLPERMPFTRSKPFTERLSMREQRKAISERLPSAKDLKTAAEKVAEKTSFVERRETLIAKMPFGERRESIIEKVPLRKV